MSDQLTDNFQTASWRMRFGVWYRRVFSIGLSLILLPITIATWQETVAEWTGAMTLPAFFAFTVVLAIAWAIAAVFLTLLVLGLDRLAASQLRAAEAPVTPAPFRDRFTRWYRRVFLWGPAILFFITAVRGWIILSADGLAAATMLPMLMELILLIILWSVVAVSVTFAIVGVQSLMKR